VNVNDLHSPMHVRYVPTGEVGEFAGWSRDFKPLVRFYRGDVGDNDEVRAVDASDLEPVSGW
jgi:hypothetical protein